MGKEASLLLVMLQTWTSLPLIKNHLCLPISVEIYKRNIMSAEFQVEKTLSYTLHVSHLEINHCKAQHCPLFPERMSLQGYTQNNAHLTSWYPYWTSEIFLVSKTLFININFTLHFIKIQEKTKQNIFWETTKRNPVSMIPEEKTYNLHMNIGLGSAIQYNWSC